MLEQLKKLIKVKSLVTLLLTIVFAYLSITGAIGEQLFMTVFSVIIAFYFGTQSEKNSKNE